MPTTTVTMKSSDLKPGMIVRVHGMRCELGPITEHPGTNNDLVVYASRATVLNYADLDADVKRYVRAESGDLHTWTIQGNDYASWEVEPMTDESGEAAAPAAPAVPAMSARRVWKGKNAKVVVTIGDRTAEFGGNRAHRANFALVIVPGPEHNVHVATGERITSELEPWVEGLRVDARNGSRDKVAYGYRQQWTQYAVPVLDDATA